MLKYYCKSCGQGTEYSSKTPAFCGYCGKSFLSKTTAKVSTFVTPPPDDDDDNTLDDDDDDADNAVTSLSAEDLELESEIIAPARPKSTLNDVLMSGVGGSKANLPSRQGPKVSQKKFLEEFSREAGSIRPQNRVRGKKK
jgi:hypothetical protein